MGKVIRSTAVNIVVRENLSGSLTLNDAITGHKLSVNDSITLKVTASGGSGEYTYKYIMHNLDTDEWITLKDYGSSNTYTNQVVYAGDKEFVVSVKDSEGREVTTNKITVSVKEILGVNITSDKTSLAVGENITFTANATGGTSPYTYSFLIHNPDKKEWYRYGNGTFKAANTHTWKASGTGTRKFYVEIKDSTGKVVRSKAVTVEIDDTNVKPLAITGIASNTNPAVGESITITGTATGGTAPYTYSFLIHNPDKKEWYRYGNGTFKEANTLTWKASGEGKRNFYVEVKDKTGKVVRSSATVISINSTEEELAVKGNASSATVAVGSNVTITGTATGGTAPYTYSFLIQNPDKKEWYRYGNGTFKEANTLTWKASGEGKRNFYIEVKDSTGKVVRSSAVAVEIR